MGLIGRLWAGEMALPAAFWRYMVAGGVIVNLAATAPALLLFALDAPVALATALLFLHAPYNLFMLVAVWRSAARWTGDPQWAGMARPAALAWTALAVVI
jgi:hypothetical protein